MESSKNNENRGGVKLIYNGETDSNGHCTSTTGTATQIRRRNFNDNQNFPAYVGYMYGTPYTFSKKSLSASDTYKFGTSVIYSGGTCTLTNAVDKIDNNHHYTYFSESETCTTVNYVHYIMDSQYYYYITITGVNPNGRELMDVVLDSMFKNDRDSTAKIEIEKWYKDNMASFTSKLEDTIYCNDRSISDVGGWSPTGSLQNKYLYFSGYARTLKYKPSLVCERELDRFAVSASLGNGKLKYPVGLITIDEIIK